MSNQSTSDPKAENIIGRINEALEFLNKEIKEKRQEITYLIGEKYSNFRDVLSETITGGVKKTKETVASGEERIKEASSEVDKKVHEHPWVSLGVTAASFLILGFVIGITTRPRAK